MTVNATTRFHPYWQIKQTKERQAKLGAVAIEPDCPLCGGIEWVRSDAMPGEPEYGKLTQCPTCSEPARRRYLAHHCGLEGVAMDARLSGWSGGDWPDVDKAVGDVRTQQRRDAYVAIRKAMKTRRGMLTFWGGFGSGKTHALNIIVNECRDKLAEAYYVPLASVLDHLRNLYGAKQDTSTYWQRLLDVPVLALDEVTRFNATDWARDKLFVLVDCRYRRRESHLTVFATNDDPRRAMLGETEGYLMSRLREGTLVRLEGDMRPAVAGNRDGELNGCH